MDEVTRREFDAYKELIDERFRALARELKLQAGKDQKHFEDLNHEQARLQADRILYLPRETYAADRKDKQATALAVFAIALEIVIALVMWWTTHK